MPAYLVEVSEFATREHAEEALSERRVDSAESDSFTIHDSPPVILGGLVKGGEYATVDEWLDGGGEALCIAADGRIVGVEDNDGAVAAEARGALPITWYVEAP